MFVLIVELKTCAAHAAALEALLQELVAYAASEAGIVHYTAQRSTTDPAEYFLVEFYQDKAAWMSHVADKYVADRIGQFENLLITQPIIKFCTNMAHTF